MARRPTRSRQARRSARLDFAGLEIVGALLTPDIVAQLAAFEANDQSEESYDIPAGLKLRDEIARYFRIGEALWSRFEAARGQSVAASERFVLDLLRQCFGFDSITPRPITRLGEREFPVRHAALGGRVPVVVAPAPAEGARRSGVDESLPQFGDSSRRRSATLLLQEYLNARDDAGWGLSCDGVTLRLLRDNISLTRPAWIEANLSKIFSEGLFPDFSALWLLIHQSRFGQTDAAVSDCALERWRDRGRIDGVTARDKLRQGVESALYELGQGFIENPANGALRQALSDGTLSGQAYFEELLRVVYRLIFLFAAEDRELLHPPGASKQARQVYAEGYSLGRLRERSMRRTAWDRHADAWEGLKATFRALARGQERLGLPALGGLFAHGVLSNLEKARIENRRFLAAIWRLAWLRPEGQPLTRVNWRDMETEELGSVYESLLELTPRPSADARTFEFAEGDETRGNERKKSGSYYTPDGLVKHLLDSTLDPVLDAAEARNVEDPSIEILKLSIVDPACGSGHFLLGAARRAAARIAKHRSPGAPSQDEFQHALREVVSHCIYGVDRNPMAVELCKVALWIEALEPGKPLTFLDSHIRCGDSLIGVFDIDVLRDGIPDDAFKPLASDDKEAASHYRAKNKHPLGGVGDVNTYAVFADHFRQAINPDGRAGLILPNGLVTGYTYREFLRHLLSTKTLASFFGFENEDKLFKSVHNETKFGLLTVTGGREKIEQPWFTAHIRQPEQITDPERRYALTIDEIEAINPNTLNLPAFRWAKDAKVTATIHKAAPVLIRKQPDGREENPWQVKFKTLFHMAGASGDFLDHQDIAPLIVERRGALAVLEDGRQVYPLYEGKMFWHFDHRYGTYEGQTEKQANKGVLPRVPDAKHADPGYRIEPRYWVDAGLTHQTLGEDASTTWFFSWRDVGISERTFIGTIIPKTASGDKSPILISPLAAKSIAALVGCLGALVTDYAVRQRAMNIKFYVLEQIPVLSPSALAAAPAWLGCVAEDWLSDRVLELCYTNEELSPFASDLDRDHPPFRWQPERRIVLQAEIDAAVLHLYGLNQVQAEWLLDSFMVLRKYEERDHNEFRTKRIVLEIYEEMAAAKQAGRAYQTRLNPVPADPSCCHPAKSAPIRPPAPALTDGAWARPPQPQPGDTGAALAAILKAMDGPRPIRDVRLMAALVLEPRLIVPLLPQDKASEWRRLVGSEAQPLAGNVAAFATRINAAWGSAVQNHRGNERLIENLQSDTWAPGVGLETIQTEGWPDGRAGFVLEALRSIDLGTAVNSLPDDIQRWIADAAAA